MRKRTIAFIFICCMTITPASIIRANEDQKEEVIAIAEELLEHYCTALENYDLKEAYSLVRPLKTGEDDFPSAEEITDEELDDYTGESYFEFYTEKLGFRPGAMSESFITFDKEIAGMYYASYGLDYTEETVYDKKDHYYSDKEDNSKIAKTLPGFELEFEIIDVQDPEECRLTMREGLTRIDYSLDELIGDRYEEAYVITYNLDWYYNGMLYGEDPLWWENQEYVDSHANKEDTYEEYIERMNNSPHTAIVYCWNGQWHLYPELIGNTFGPLILE